MVSWPGVVASVSSRAAAGRADELACVCFDVRKKAISARMMIDAATVEIVRVMMTSFAYRF